MSEPCAKRKRTTRPIDGWEAHAARVKKQRLSEDSLRDDIRSQHVQGLQEPVPHIKVSLKYPDSGPRIDVPVRSVNCKHAQCFDLVTYLKERDRNLLGASKEFVTWKCPICSASAEIHELRVDGYFEAILRKYAELRNVDEVQILSDTTHRPVLQPKVEVIPVSESPFVRPESAENDEVKPPPSYTQDPPGEHESLSEYVENTDLDLEAIKRLSDAHPLCRDAKRKLLWKFKQDEKKKKLEAGETMNDWTTVADEVDDYAASGHAGDVNDSSWEDGSPLGSSCTLTTLSPRVQQRSLEVAEDYLDPLSLRFVALCCKSDSSNSEFDAPARNRQSPTSLQEIVKTDMEITGASTSATDDIDDNIGSSRADVVDDSSGAQLLYSEADTSLFHDLFGTTHDASLRTLVQMRHDSQLAGSLGESRAVDEKIKALRCKIKKIKNSRQRAVRLTMEPATNDNQHEESHWVSVASVSAPVERDRPRLSGERPRGTGKHTTSPARQEATDAKRPRVHQQMLRTISNTLGNRNEAIKRRMTMIGKLEKELEENPHGPPWTQKVSRKRAGDWRREREDRVRKYKEELPEIEKELVEWQKTRIVYKALHAHYIKRHEEDKFIAKLAEDDCTNPIQILADLWSSESASDRSALFMQCIVEAPEAFKNQPGKIAEFKANFSSAEAFGTFFQVRHDIRITAKEPTGSTKSS